MPGTSVQLSKKIKRGTIAAGALLAWLSAGAAIGAQTQSHWTIESVLKQLDASSGSFHSLSADLERTKVTVVVNDKSTESGQILVRRDEKMRIEMTKPDPRTILRSGNSLFIYNPKINQADEYDLKKYKTMVDRWNGMLHVLPSICPLAMNAG